MASASQDSSLDKYERFFSRIAPLVQATRNLEDELNRRLAHRFNVFDYLDTLELGLSKLIADLLDPSAAHGQGALFLKTFFHLFRPDFLDSKPDFSGTQVTIEKLIPKQRKIDVFVRIPCAQSDFCLAFEIKPYAVGQKDQVHDYLNYLKDSCFSDFLLIYLSPRGEMPTDWSIKWEDLESWGNRFAVMPYVNEHINEDRGEHDASEHKDSQNFLTNGSLVDWITKCRHSSDVERLRLFLGDAERFCQTTFGRSKMGSNNEIQTLKDYLETNPDLLDSAQIVYEAWPSLREDIFKRFLNQVLERVKQEVESMNLGEGLQCDCSYSDKQYGRLWLYRTSWKTYDNSDKSFSKGRTSICLSSWDSDLKRWIVGVRSPMSENSMNKVEPEARKNLESQLRGKGIGNQRNRWWPVYRNIERSKTDWNKFLRDLKEELTKTRGDITEHYVNEFVDVVHKAICVIDRVEKPSDKE